MMIRSEASTSTSTPWRRRLITVCERRAWHLKPMKPMFLGELSPQVTSSFRKNFDTGFQAPGKTWKHYDVAKAMLLRANTTQPTPWWSPPLPSASMWGVLPKVKPAAASLGEAKLPPVPTSPDAVRSLPWEHGKTIKKPWKRARSITCIILPFGTHVRSALAMVSTYIQAWQTFRGTMLNVQHIRQIPPIAKY